MKGYIKMIDSIILHMQLTHREKDYLMPLIPISKKYWRNRQLLFLDGQVRLNMVVGNDFQYLRLTIHNVSEVLQCEQVTNNDYDRFVFIINSILHPFNLDLHTFILREIHYKLDVKTTPLEKKEYLWAIAKHKSKYRNVEKTIYADDAGNITGIRFKPKIKETSKKKEVGHEATIYDKDCEMKIRPQKFREHLQDVLRFEIKVKKKMLDKYFKKYGIEKSLHNYWDSSMREDFFNELLLERFIGEGDYYNLTTIKTMIKGDKLEKKVLQILKEIQKNDVDFVYGKYAWSTVDKYFGYLGMGNINPVTLQQLSHLDGLRKLLKPNGGKI
jgi:hypothetical protein